MHTTKQYLRVAGLVVALVMAALLIRGVQAQEMTAQTFLVQAGVPGPANMELLSFVPQRLQVHRGDVVVWSNNGFHNIHFEPGQVEMVVVQEVDGVMTPIINPAIPFPSVENGAAFSGGEANSGLPSPDSPPVFSLLFDAEPGAYTYFCDIHPGMAGVIEVVADDVAVPTPIEAALGAGAQVGEAVGAGFAAIEAASAAPMVAEGDSLAVMAGAGAGQLTVQEFFPFSGVISAGQSVTWTISPDTVEPHTISWPPILGQDVVPVEQEGGPPILAVGPTLLPITASGAEVGAGDAFSSGLVFPGDTFTMTFTDPGVYPYVCNIHPGMSGVIVVQ